MDAHENNPTAVASIATPETDAALRESEMRKGRQAAQAGLSTESCPWSGGLARTWWLEGHAGRLGPIQAS